MTHRHSFRIPSLSALIALTVFSLARSAPGDTTPRADASPPVIRSTTISAEQLPDVFPPARTFHYRLAHVEDPESLLLDLWEAGLRPRRAWQPMDNRCFDPIGPRFTVELRTNDPRILELGFERGEGRIRCATTLTRYRIRRQTAQLAIYVPVQPFTYHDLRVPDVPHSK